jgi:outer membrane protein assembly factor BamB
MADVFVSYKKEDRQRAQFVVDALVRAGLSVWWDDDLTPRTTWDEEIEREIKACEAVLVLWTPRSVSPKSFVRNEADYAVQANKLVPARIEDCELPLAFRRFQTADLTTWNSADDAHQEWQRVLGWIADLKRGAGNLERIEQQTASLRSSPKQRSSRRAVVAGVGAAVLGTGAVAAILSPSGRGIRSGVQITAAGRSFGLRGIERIGSLPNRTLHASLTSDAAFLLTDDATYRNSSSTLRVWSFPALVPTAAVNGLVLFNGLSALSADGNSFLASGKEARTGYRNGVLSQTEIRSGREIKQVQTGKSVVNDAAIAADDEYVVASADMGFLGCWSLRDGSVRNLLELTRRRTHDGDGQAIPESLQTQEPVYFCLSPDRSRVFVTAGQSVLALGIPDFDQMWSVRLDGSASGLAISSDGKLLKVGARRILDAATGQTVSNAPLNVTSGNVLAFNESEVATQDGDGVTIWNPRTGEERRTFAPAATGDAKVVTSSAEILGGIVLLGMMDGRVHLFNKSTGDQLATFRALSPESARYAPVRGIACSTNSAAFVTVGEVRDGSTDTADAHIWQLDIRS